MRSSRQLRLVQLHKRHAKPGEDLKAFRERLKQSRYLRSLANLQTEHLLWEAPKLVGRSKANRKERGFWKGLAAIAKRMGVGHER